jgi:hypothetical protein
MSRPAHSRSSIWRSTCSRSTSLPALLASLLIPLAACARPATWGYASAQVAAHTVPMTWGYATLPAGEPAPAVAGFSKQAAPAAGPTAWGFAKLPASPAPEVTAKR